MSNEDLNEKKQSIFLDKLSITSTITNKELQLISLFHNVSRKIFMNEIDKSEISKNLDYTLVWQNLIMFFDLFEFDGIDKLKEEKEQLDYLNLVSLAERYRKFDHTLNYDDMCFFYNKIRKVIYLSGYHDVTLYGNRDKRDFLKPSSTW